ncbi:integrase [Alloscardovia theropitheci]|uniref:Integrase n=1 Tax=Alloscardovia theropitheci TaxID=2496842 RepID=A0A4R0QUW7_9BIFI|nr:tyrosine-type recombinase/integrase [Alloscardovia theropitheci]TCD53867.1 integrase [Alloscardovia theropitheci]
MSIQNNVKVRKLILASAWRDYAEGWLEWLRASGYADTTIKSRYYKLVSIARLVDCDPLDVSEQLLVHVFAAQPWKRETRKGYFATVRSFYHYLLDNEIIDVDPTRRLPRIKKEHSLPRVCPENVVHHALAKAHGDKKLIAMIRLGAECGLRRSEIAQVNSHDLITINGSTLLLVHGKGSKERVVPIARDLARYIHDQYGFVYPGRWANHVEASYIAKHITAVLDQGYTTHSLRHRYATKMYETTHDILLVSKLLGHESVETTQIYLHINLPNAGDLTQAVMCGSPL